MGDDAYLVELRLALAKALGENFELRQQLAGADARAQKLREILAHEELLFAGHDRLLERVDRAAQKPVEPRFRLRVFDGKKRDLTPPVIDCAARWAACRGRCCAFAFQLTAEDVAENKIAWEPSAPFQIRQEADGFCHHFDRQGQGCTAYEDRPATCRTFTCENDPRVWIDFEKGIAQPWPPSHGDDDDP